MRKVEAHKLDNLYKVLQLLKGTARTLNQLCNLPKAPFSTPRFQLSTLSELILAGPSFTIHREKKGWN